MISGFSREVDENCALRGHYASPYRRFETTYLSLLQESRIKKNETSVRNYQYSVRHNSQERSSQKESFFFS